MKRAKVHISLLSLWAFVCLCSFSVPVCGQEQVLAKVENGDTVYVVALHDPYVYEPLKFKNKRQERFYWRTVRDVKKTLPYARMIRADMEFADEELAKIQDPKERKRGGRNTRNTSLISTKDDFRHSTLAGQMLMP